ncbi:MAG: YidC/Oxa1 family membrane protein insertase [Candidatus Chisholmbacteria bacterium]|nr:YidC/Oxa1 family membrane protein insertase [Candidatus Chisholmbacteria bacterium]
MLELYTTFIYQPFLNLLVGFYYFLQQIPSLPYADMGVAVILFTIALRIILLPLTFSSQRSETERRRLEDKVKDLRQEFRTDPVRLRQEIKKLFRASPRMVISSAIDLFIQVVIALMLWRIFAKGLLGADLHLIYDFMPDIPRPYDLKFLGEYDLTHPNLKLNLMQSLVIFAVETLSLISSPFPVTRGDVIRLEVILPLTSFLIFSQLPAGKKLFIITTLLFTFCFQLLRLLRRFFTSVFPSPQPVIVDTSKVE